MTEQLSNYIDKLQSKRKEKRISYDELAMQTGLPRTTITNTLLKYLKKSPSAEVLNKLAIALDYPTIEENIQGVSTYEITPDKEELLMLYEELSEEGKSFVLKYIRLLVDGDKE